MLPGMQAADLDPSPGMNPKDQLMELLAANSFDLVRQRKHRVYRNPEGQTFVVASTPSDSRAWQNALGTLKRVLRQANSAREPQVVSQPSPLLAEAALEAANTLPALPVESQPAFEPPSLGATPPEPVPEFPADGRWEEMQWIEDGRRSMADDNFLSAVSGYVDTVSELMYEHQPSFDLEVATDAVKKKLRAAGYKSKVLLYDGQVFERGVIVKEIADLPILWASNGRIAVSAFLLFNTYLEHGQGKMSRLRFDCNSFVLLCERPEDAARRLYVPPESPGSERYQFHCESCGGGQECHERLLMRDQGWTCRRCGKLHKLELRCEVCKTGIIRFTQFGLYCPQCSRAKA
ncbi:MAG: hypothetical protein JO041_05150 [Acidobacteria bacterium]|nr:hypothetical protein [Acidobacteriota bacterium]